MTINTLEDGKKILKKHYDKQLDIAKKSDIEADIVWVEMKYSHSMDVFKISEYLIENDEILSGLDDKYKIYGKLAALLHDIGRAYKIGENKTKIEPHGIFGAEEILRKIEKEDNPFILLPIKFHDSLTAEENVKNELKNYNLSKKEENIILLLLALVKDSDKLANFELFKTLNDKIFMSLEEKLYWTEKSLNCFKNKTLVVNKERETVFDQLLSYITWSYDLFFSASKKFILDKDCIMNLIKIVERKASEIKKDYSQEDIIVFYEKLDFIKNQLKKDNFILNYN